MFLILAGWSLQNVCEHPLTRECDQENDIVVRCADNAVVMWLRRSTCTCQAGYYFVEARDDQPAQCAKCDDICSSVCRGPATRSQLDGKEVLLPNENCPAVSPGAILSGDIESEQEKEATRNIGNLDEKARNEANKRHRFYLFGQPCYSYEFDDLYFYIPTPYAVYRVKQDYSIENYPARENRYIGLTSWSSQADNQIQTSCTRLYQTAFWYAGQSMIEIKDFIGESRPHTAVHYFEYYPWDWRYGWLANGEVFNLVAFMESSNVVVAASHQMKIIMVFKIIF